MSLREKAAQVLLVGFDGTTLTPGTAELLAYGPPGGLLLLGYNVSGAEQLRMLTSSLQEAAAAAGSAVGLLIAVDQEGGSVQRIHEGAPDLPAPRDVAETSSPEQAARLAAATALALLDLGVNMNLAPVADVVSDPGSFLYSRTYAGDPAVVSTYVAAVVEAFAKNGLIAVIKHFPGHGSAAGNPHGESVISYADEESFATVHLPPFQAAFASGAECVMVAHLIATAYDPDSPASLSSAVVEGLLRDRLGFAGLVVTDDLGMAAVTAAGPGASGDSDDAAQAAGVGSAAVAALGAGCDLLICTGTSEQHLGTIDAIVKAVESGILDLHRLDQAVLRVLDLKLRHGLVAQPVP
jgi:beta-N-acetylhexosaminidase